MSFQRAIKPSYERPFHLDILCSKYVRLALNGVATWCRHQTETFLRYWSFVRGIHRSPVDFPHKGQRREALVLPLICTWLNNWETIETLVIWDATRRSLWRHCNDIVLWLLLGRARHLSGYLFRIGDIRFWPETKPCHNMLWLGLVQPSAAFGTSLITTSSDI